MCAAILMSSVLMLLKSGMVDPNPGGVFHLEFQLG